MQIYDEAGNLLPENVQLDLERGYVENRTKTIEHPYKEYIPEVSHYETIAEYPNGGKDVIKIIDEPGQQEEQAWTETVDYQVYVLYSEEEYNERQMQKQEQELVENLREAHINYIGDLIEENKLLKAQVQAMSDRNDFIEDCIAEMAEIVYA